MNVVAKILPKRYLTRPPKVSRNSPFPYPYTIEKHIKNFVHYYSDQKIDKDYMLNVLLDTYKHNLTGFSNVIISSEKIENTIIVKIEPYQKVSEKEYNEIMKCFPDSD
tara:strand:- start:853 stop:1176 length:324 start_codon:yes stop_codon:yes gene_type:complete